MAKRDISALVPYYLIVSSGKWHTVECLSCGYKSKLGLRYDNKLSSGNVLYLLQHGMSCAKLNNQMEQTNGLHKH